MLPIIEAIFPVFSLIIIGFIFKRYGFPGDPFWPLAERATYYAFFPALLVNKLAVADFAALPIFDLSLAIIAATLLISLLMLAAGKLYRGRAQTFTSIFQGSIRPNTYIGLAAGGSLFGEEGLAIIAISIAVLIPLVNVLSVTVLYCFLQPKRREKITILLQIIKNPIIIGCIIGLLLNVSRIGLPLGSKNLLTIFASIALPLGLLSVGAGLKKLSTDYSFRELAAPLCAKLILFPLLTGALCMVFGVRGPALSCAVLFTSLPASASSYILAGQMGGDARIMANIISLGTLLSLFTIPLMLKFSAYLL